jgi:hypothetical protein
MYVPQLQRMMHACINHSVIRVDIPAVKARQDATRDNNALLSS